MPRCHRRTAIVHHLPLARDCQRPVLSQYPEQVFSALARGHTRQLLQNLRLYCGFGLARFILEDFFAARAGVVFVITWGVIGRCNRLGFGHIVAKGRNNFRFPCGFYRTVRIPENPAAVGADIVSIASVLRAGRFYPRDSLQIVNMQGAIVDGSICQRIIIISDFNCFPLLGRTGIVYIF